MNKGNIIVYTSEKLTSFVYTEVEKLREFDPDSVVVTTENNSESERIDNTRLIDFEKSTGILVRHFVKHLPFFVWLILMDAVSPRSNFAYLLAWRARLSILLRCSIVECELNSIGHFKEGDIHYSYYLNEFALILALAKYRGHIARFYSRAHGRDVVESREPVTKKLPFNWFKYKYIDKVYCVSTKTRDYISGTYPDLNKKLEVSYLGTEDRGIGPMPAPQSEYHIVSVGRVRNVKRFYLIAEMLAYCKINVRWSHFGDERKDDPTLQRFHAALDVLSQRPNIIVELMGFVPNHDILNYYSNNYVDCLVNSSEIEGLPVSIQEATSFGIPCLATDVGGTSDIVNEHTGLLVDEGFEPKNIAEKLEAFLAEKCRDELFRKSARSFWKSNFDGSVNYPNFFRSLIENR